MILLDIKSGNKTNEFKLPENGKELSFKQLINFNVAKAHWLKIVEQHNDFMNIESILALVNMLCEFWECDDNSLLGLEISYEDLHRGIEALSNTPQELSAVHSKLMSVVTHIDNVIRRIEPRPIESADHTFEYKGEIYVIPFEKAYEALTEMARPVLTLGQVKEVMEIKRKYGNLAKKGDPSGSYAYTEGIKTLAILALKKDEIFPAQKTTEFIAQRMYHFSDISAQAYYDVSFFLTRIGSQLKMTTNSVTSLILLKKLQDQPNTLN